VFQYYVPDRLPRLGVGTARSQTAESAADLGSTWLGDYRSLWLVTLNDAYDADPDGHLRRWLEARARIVADIRVDNKRLTLLTTDPTRTIARPAAIEPSRRFASVQPADPRPIGVDSPIREIPAGTVWHLASYWQSERPGDTRYHLELVADDESVVQRVGGRLREDWPAAAWPAGRAVRVEHALPLSDRLRAGPYRLRLTQTTGAGTVVHPEPLARIQLLPPASAPRPVQTPPSPPLPPRHDRFGNLIELVGAVTPTEPLASGATIEVTLLWQAIQASERPYTAFVQIVGERLNPATGNAVWAQSDGPPGGDRPTNEWLPGDLALDRRRLVLPDALPPGRYELIVGLYDQDDLRRLTLLNGRDHVLLRDWP
jgi:hypothetical protein